MRCLALMALVFLTPMDLGVGAAAQYRLQSSMRSARAVNCRKQDSELGASLEEWSDEELAAMRDIDIDGQMVRYSRGELIAHLMLHERGHHGDITTLMWQLDLDVDLPIEYRFFLGRH